MTHDIQCTRKDCDFHYLGGCGYGGTAVQISERGCRTHESAAAELVE